MSSTRAFVAVFREAATRWRRGISQRAFLSSPSHRVSFQVVLLKFFDADTAELLAVEYKLEGSSISDYLALSVTEALAALGSGKGASCIQAVKN